MAFIAWRYEASWRDQACVTSASWFVELVSFYESLVGAALLEDRLLNIYDDLFQNMFLSLPNFSFCNNGSSLSIIVIIPTFSFCNNGHA
jgi:hypothetical protein